MKGIAHFSSAVAVASFLPHVVARSAQGSFVLLLAGLGGLAPDTLDFRLARFLPRPDVEIGTDPADAVPADLAQAVADRLAAGVERAHQTGRAVYARLDAVRLGADLWQQYSVRFAGRQVWVRSGPLVDGSQAPVEGETRDGVSPVSVQVLQADASEVVVDVFSGTALQFKSCGERVEIVFLPWHRRWSHSLTFAAFLGGIAALLLGPLSGLVYFLGSLTHIVEDQLGYMGSNILYPITRKRIGGLKLFRSGDALPNLFTVWLSVVCLLLNLDRFSPNPVLDPWRLLVVGVVLPWGLICVLWWLAARRRPGHHGGEGAFDRQTMLVDVSQDGERALTE